MKRIWCSRVVIAGVVCVGTLGCKPWTVRPIDDAARGGSQSAAHFDSAAYVEGIWQSKVLPSAQASAEDLAVIAVAKGTDGTNERRHVFVRGRARVTEIDTHSRAGLIYLDARAADVQSRVALQIGPVLRGTALRDALTFIRFSDFINQMDFAAVSTELNNRVLRSVLAGMDPTRLAGKVVSFQGAATLPAPGTSATLEIVPVLFQVEDTAK